jgi:hypothetical protein
MRFATLARMSITSIPSATNVQSLANNVLQQFDTDQDGRLSVDEFSQFLNRLIDSLAGGENGAQSLTSSLGQTAPLTSLTPAISTGQYRSTLEGFDMQKLDDPSKTSVKYQAARVFQNYAPTVDNLADVVTALNDAGLTATQVGDDTIDFGGSVGKIDVIRAAGDGGRAWQWLPTA